MEPHKPRRPKANYEGKIAGLYDLEETIGRGHFAVVKLARHVFTGEKVAVKVIDKTKLDEVSKAHLFQEVRCMKLVQHPNVVRLYEVIDTQTKLYLILELGDGGDMYDYIMKHDKGLDEEVAKRYFKQIVQAINYCHKLHVVHRDLKPENVVFFEKLGIVKLTDFGFSNKFIPGRQLETSCGSLAYSAPEILLGDAYDAPAVDVWSLGVILFMLVCGEAPFQEANDSETLTMIMDCKYRLPPTISDACRDLIGRMLKRDPGQRALLEEIMIHRWLKTGDMAPIPLMPLISREDISEDDHVYILQRMVDGKIATKEEIVLSLEKNAYDHITATYYLLAERRLKKHREAQPMMSMRKQQDSDNKPPLAPLALSPRSAKQKLVNGIMITCTCEDPRDQCQCVQSGEAAQAERRRAQQIHSLVSPPGIHSAAPTPLALTPQSPSPTLPRRCSLIQEESIDEDAEEEMETVNFHTSRSVDECLSDDSDSHSADRSPSRGHAPRRAQTVRPLHSVRSSPQLLNQIFEECESQSEDDSILLNKKHSSPHLCQRNSITSPEVMRKYEHTRKKRITAGSRGTSCSSSDASDTDETDSRKRKEKLKQKFHRRDSSDHSSDTDGPSGFGPGGGGRSLGGSSSKERTDGKDRDRSQNNKGGNDENKHSSKSRERRQSGGKQNGSLNSSKKFSSGSSENLGSEVGYKISSLSITSSMSNISGTGSLSSRGSKYLVEASSNTMPTPTLSRNKEEAAMNEENKYRSRIIHVRSKDFSDLMDRFKTRDDGSGSRDHVKFRRRPKDKMKTDINRNGLIANADGELTEMEAKGQQQNSLGQTSVKTKCCSLV